MTSPHTPVQQQEENRCRKKSREYGAAFCFVPVLFFCFDLSNKNWVDSENGTSEGFDLQWKHSTYFIVAALFGAVGGALAALYPGRVHKEWIAGILAGLVGAPSALGFEVLYLNNVSRTNNIVVFLVAFIGGGIPYACVYLGIREYFLSSRVATATVSSATELSPQHDDSALV